MGMFQEVKQDGRTNHLGGVTEVGEVKMENTKTFQRLKQK